MTAPKDDTRETVFSFIEKVKELPRKITIERTHQSRYHFFFLVRFYRKRLGVVPRFITYSKYTATSTKSLLEEHSLFEDKIRLIVLDGFKGPFVQRLMIPEGTHVLAEVPKANLKVVNYAYSQRRGIVKSLKENLNIDFKLRHLLNLEWGAMKSYEDYEVFFRRAKIMGWSLEEMGNELQAMEIGKVLVLLKKGSLADVEVVSERFSPAWVYGYITRSLIDLVLFKYYRNLGWEPQKIGNEIGCNYFRTQELIEADRLYTYEDVEKMTSRLVELDEFGRKNKRQALDLFVVSVPGRLRT